MTQYRPKTITITAISLNMIEFTPFCSHYSFKAEYKDLLISIFAIGDFF